MRPAFSIVIPTYNEEHDIDGTLASVFAQTVAPLDVVVVDGGSTDLTLPRVREATAGHRAVVIEEGVRRGVAAARNTGIRAARGDIVVFLNADVTLPPDFLARLAAVYEDGGIDALSVDSRVENLDAATGRYLEAVHRLRYAEHAVGWSEGFSCRRRVALNAMFPEQIPGAGGEDVAFLDRIRRSGCRWRADYSIAVSHRTPETLGGFWRQFQGRGRAVPYMDRGVRGMALPAVVLRRALVALKTIVIAAALAPNAVTAVRLARRSPRGLRDVYAFWLLHHVLFAALRTGEWQTLREMWRTRRQTPSHRDGDDPAGAMQVPTPRGRRLALLDTSGDQDDDGDLRRAA